MGVISLPHELLGEYEVKIAMIGWEYPPFKIGGLGTHCFGLTQGLANYGVVIDFYMPKTSKRVKSAHKQIHIIKIFNSLL